MNQIRMAGSRNRNQVKPPPGWTWKLPFKIYKNPKTGTFNVGKWKIENQVPRTGGTYYVSKSGNDTTGNGLSWATAWLTVAKAYATVPAFACVYVGEGRYGWGESTGIDKSISIIAIGDVIFDSKLPHTWALVAGKTHTYSSDGGGTSRNVVDWGTLDAEGLPTFYTKKATVDEVEATPGSFYCLTVAPYTCYVHPLDAGAPDADIRGLYGGYIINLGAGTRKVYFENIISIGQIANTNLAATTGYFYLKNCKFINTLLDFASYPAIFQNCFYRGYITEDDAQRDLLYASGAKIIEIDCGGHTSGGTAYNSSNVTTNHGTGENVIIGGEYYGTYGPPIGFINHTKCWLLGVYSHDNLAVGSNFYSFQLSGDLAYLDNCRSSGSVKDIGCNTAHVRNFQGDSTSDGNLVEY